ncbi:MAG: ribosome silencing factor [Lachnospiraceae bacterium]|nr:ribosome silencing factor [Lachnospiraceae bacterium]
MIVDALNDKKAENVKVLDISEISYVADAFVIANGNNINQIQTMADSVMEKLGKNGYPEKGIEGYKSGDWILIDFNDVIVHIFDKENRSNYDLERLWRDAKLIECAG